MFKTLPLAVLLVCGVAATAAAQPATTVQQPTFNFNTVNTTVTAPDGGTVLLGGIKRLSEGSTERGVPLLGKVPGLNRLFRNRGIGREVSNSSYTVTPRIIILEEEEERQVGNPATYGTAFGPSAPKAGDRGGLAGYYYNPENAANFARASAISSQIQQQHQQSLTLIRPSQTAHQAAAQTNTADNVPAAAVIEARNAAAAATRSAEAVAYFEKANRAAGEGKTGAAKIYYRMAARRASGDFREEILQAMESLLSQQ